MRRSGLSRADRGDPGVRAPGPRLHPSVATATRIASMYWSERRTGRSRQRDRRWNTVGGSAVYSLMAIFENQQGLQEWSWCGLRNRLRRCVYCCPLLPRYALAITIDRVVGSASSAAVENSRPTAVVVLGSIESIQTRRCSRTVNLSSLSEE